MPPQAAANLRLVGAAPEACDLPLQPGNYIPSFDAATIDRSKHQKRKIYLFLIF
jgi:hypothetical protein